MQTVGPYRIGQALGTCPVGGVWSAVDAANNQVTVAMLTGAAAHDPGWRNAFATTANAVAQSSQLSVIAGDYTESAPWIASAARDGSVLGQVFVALGMELQPVTDSEQPTAMMPKHDERLAPSSGSPMVSHDPVSPVSAGQPSSPPWHPPHESSPISVSPSGTPPPGSPHTVAPFSFPPSEPPRRRRAGLLIAVMLLVVALLGGGALAVVLWPDEGEPQAQPSTSPTPSPQEPALPPPSQPGLEPPVGRAWPSNWPVFEADDPVSPMSGLIGERPGQAFQLPEGWDCPSVSAEGTFAQYECGPDGDATEIGGDLIIRSCPDPCDVGRRDQMRAEVEAWGLQWLQDSGFRYWAEDTEIDGEERYGLVMVAYYRTNPEGRVDRQLVLRMAAPIDQIDEIRKIAGSVRDAIRQ